MRTPPLLFVLKKSVYIMLSIHAITKTIKGIILFLFCRYNLLTCFAVAISNSFVTPITPGTFRKAIVV